MTTQTDALELAGRLEGFAKAYPEDAFPELTAHERVWLKLERPGLQDRIAASMGRHFAKFAIEAAQALRALQAERAGCDPDGCKAHIDAFMQRALAAEATLAKQAQEIAALREALGHALDDMGAAGLSVCGYVKALMRHAVGPAEGEGFDYSYDDALAVMISCDESHGRRSRLRGEQSARARSLAQGETA